VCLARPKGSRRACVDRLNVDNRWRASAEPALIGRETFQRKRMPLDNIPGSLDPVWATAFAPRIPGSHSGEHGDGLVRSEFHAAMFGGRLVRAFEEVKDAFDPQGLSTPARSPTLPDLEHWCNTPIFMVCSPGGWECSNLPKTGRSQGLVCGREGLYLGSAALIECNNGIHQLRQENEVAAPHCRLRAGIWYAQIPSRTAPGRRRSAGW
jgi:FAD linked oxidases, C-terminal domain